MTYGEIGIVDERGRLSRVSVLLDQQPFRPHQLESMASLGPHVSVAIKQRIRSRDGAG